MKNIVLIAAALLMTIAANAQRGPGACTVNLERETFRGNGFRFVQSFTEFGRYACEDARAECRAAKRARAFSYEYRCEQEFNRPAVRSCEFRIQTRRGYTTERFSVRGVRPCQTARQRCEDELSYQRRWGMVGRAAQCVKTSGRNNPAPRPGRNVTRTCSVELLAGLANRPTGNFYSGTATSASNSVARRMACDRALSKCNAVRRGNMSCVIR